MSEPVRFRSIENSGAVEAGEPHRTKGHLAYTMYVLVESSVTDPTTLSLTVDAEGSPTEGDFVPLEYRAPDTPETLRVTQDNLSETDEGNFAAHVSTNSIPTEFVRANATAAGADVSSLTVDFMLNGWTQRGTRYKLLGDRQSDRPYPTQ